VKLSNLSFFLVVITGAAFAACGSSSRSTGGGLPGGGPDASTISTDGGISLINPDSSVAQGALAITPLAPALTVVTGSPVPTQQFSATLGGQPASGVTWSIDRGELGTISASGLFTPAGTIGGVGDVSASVNGQTATTTITINIQTTDLGDPAYTATPGDAGAGGYGGVGGNGPGAPPSGAQTGSLNGSPTADPSVSILYPYDGTVWPQGILAPLLQWNPGAYSFDSVYVHIQENNFDYKGYFATNTAGPFINVPIPAAAWSTIGFSNGGEPVKVSLVFAQGTSAYGPYTETWTIAQATLQGTIYYNSYGTALVKNSDVVNPDGNPDLDYYGNQYGAGTLGINPGATAPTLVAGEDTPDAGTGCRVCHTVAANGQSLVTQASNYNASDYSNTVGIDLAHDTTGGAGTSLATTYLTYPALYKDGSLLLSSAGGFPYTQGTSALYTGAGAPVAGVTGLPAGLQATLPTFSPDGKHVSFNFWGGSLPSTDGGAALAGDQASLAMLDFDGASVFSNPRVLYTPTGGAAVTYSSFFPNGAGVVFEIELSKPSGSWGYTWDGNTAELWWLDVASGTPHRLDALNGYGPTGTPYLPNQPVPDGGTAVHTPAQDVTLNYEATVNPIASGGYAWVVFTSRRMYGNVAQLSPWTSDPRSYPWLDQVTDKKLWVAAVDLNATPGTDPSHPAFYLPAQELHAGNARGYWTVEPCRGNGQGCVTGDQCCGGFCQPSEDGGGLQCTAVAPPCAAQYEKCTTTSDCCSSSAGIQCVNGVCTQSAPK
jgi:hypothetical protein